MNDCSSVFIDDKGGKSVGIHHHIGNRLSFAAGNSDGDFQMLEWTTSGPGRAPWHDRWRFPIPKR